MIEAMDGWPAELALLAGPEAGELLATVVEATGSELAGWTPRQVSHQPGSSTVVQYQVDLVGPDGHRSRETFVATTGRVPDGALVLESGDQRVAMWRWPRDPALPGLAAALDVRRVTELLADVGFATSTPRFRVRAYRPGRRAVVEVTTGTGRLFLKVVRPSRAAGIHERHRLLAAHLPVPQSLGWSDAGILVLLALPGRTLRELVRGPARFPLPEPGAVVAVLDRLPEELAEGHPVAAPITRIHHYAAVLGATLPAVADRAAELADRIAAVDLEPPATAPAHGDFYESQLLVDGGRVVGLLDVDTAGAGSRADDLANLCGHLSVLTTLPGGAPRAQQYGGRVLRHVEPRIGRRSLRTRIAASILGLATGPFRVLEPGWPAATERRLDLADAWLDGAGRGAT